MDSRTNDTLKNLLPAYALGALDDDEARSVAAHLGDHPDCERELAELQDVVTALALNVPPATPPGAVKAALVARADALASSRDPPSVAG